MNAHIPQSYEAAAELAEIAAVPHQIIRPRDSMPVIGVVQDALAGSYLCTLPGNKFTRREFMNMMMKNRRFSEVPKPMEDNRYTGQQIIGTLLAPINLTMPNKMYKKPEDGGSAEDYNMVKIVEGEFLQGVLDKSIFNTAGKGIVHTTYNDYGPKAAVELLDGIQNMMETYLIMKGFSVGISDLIADEKTRDDMNKAIAVRKKELDDLLLSLHTGLFTNNSGKTNQEEFEARANTILTKALSDAGKIGVQSLSAENRLMTMVRSGSKGDENNVAQMISCLGQVAVEGKRIPYGFTDRTLPHFKMFDDGAEARGFVESSFLRGLTPTEFFFHAMAGREGLIDTAVKSVTGNTPIVILEDGKAKTVAIGDWIDAQLNVAKDKVEHFEERDMELLQLENKVYIPTADADGNVSWGEVSAITRHDPGKELYEIKTAGGKDVIVTESKSLLIWNSESAKFERMSTPDVKPGHYVPTTMYLPTPPHIQTHISVEDYLKKNEYIYGTDFNIASRMTAKDKENGWWNANNGISFTLPYTRKALFDRCLTRSNTTTIQDGYVYPFTTNRSGARIPEKFELNEKNGIFMGLFLAEGNVDIRSGYIQITNNDADILNFVKEWFASYGIKHAENSKINAIGGITTCVRGYSTVLAQFLTRLVGHGAKNKIVPSEAFVAPEEFVVGLLNGYFSGDGTISENSVEASSASKALIDGISMLCTRLGIFGKVFTTQMESNNLGTETICDAHRIAIRAQWATRFAERVELMDSSKNKKMLSLRPSALHRNFVKQNDVVLDEIVEINTVDVKKYPKVYDLTVPSTLNFGLANGLHVVDTADTGYTQRQLIKAMENLMTQHDGTVRDGMGKIVQFRYGEDGIASTKLEGISLPLEKLTDQKIRKEFGMEGADLTQVLAQGIDRGDDAELLKEYVDAIFKDRKMIVEGVFANGRPIKLNTPLNLERIILNIKTKFALKKDQPTNLTPKKVLEDIQTIIDRTQPSNKIWAASLRFHLAPHKMIVNERFTKEAWDAMVEIIVVKNWKSWAIPGELVGIVAAQSIGEPATQMSASKTTKIVVNLGKNTFYKGEIGKFIDDILEKNKSKVITIAENSVVLDLEEDIEILGVSENEKTSWRRISQVSRHPANGGMVEVHTRSGRKTTATLTHSFLKRSTTGIVPVLGSDLRVGMRIPVARKIPEVNNPTYFVKKGDTIFTLDKEFGWLCGIYLADGSCNGNTVVITKIAPIVEEILSNLCEKYGWELTTKHYQGEYGPTKENRIASKDLRDFLLETFGQGSYTKKIGGLVYNASVEFIKGVIGGYFDGDGNVSASRQMIRAGSRSEELIRDINNLLGYCDMFGVLGREKTKNMPGKIMHTVNIPKKFAALYKKTIGFELPEKANELQKIIDYNDREDVHSQQEMIDKIPELGGIIAQTGKLLRMPGQSRTFGRWMKKESIGRRTLEEYIEQFKEMMKVYVDPIVETQVKTNIALLESALEADVVWDEIVDLVYLDDPKEYVYDFTVPGNDSFMVDDNILVHNTLNSVDWDTEIIIAKNGKIVTPQIGEFIDNYYNTCKDETKIQRLPNNQIYIPLDDGNDWKAISCDEDGNMRWTKLEAITRHPVVNEDGSDTILKVTLESGRVVKATKAKSFLTLQNGKIIGTNGSELKVGDELPIGNSLSLRELNYIKEVNLRDILPPSEYMYGSEVKKALDIMNTTSERYWFQKNQGTVFTVPYSRSDAFRDAFQHGKNSNDIRSGNVYNKHMKQDVCQIPETIQLTEDFGFFAGAYLAEGMCNTNQVCISNNDDKYLTRIKEFMDSWNVGTHKVCDEKECKTTNIKGTTTSLIIHSTILAKIMKTWFGRVSYEKTLPDWVFQAPDDFIKGLVDGYISGDGTVTKKDNSIRASSVSEKLLTRLGVVFARYGIYTKMSSYMPEKKSFNSVSKHYTLTIPTKYSNIFHNTFKLSIDNKQERLDTAFSKRKGDTIKCKWKETREVVWDKIKSIEEVRPMGEGWVYDLTVESTRTFCTTSMMAMYDTFHQAGVAAKSAMTRGVPRLKELLKLTKNPKATSITIALKPAFRNDMDMVRQVSQDLELTLLKDIVNKAAIYYDPDDESTILPEDRDIIEFFKATEIRALSDTKIPSEDEETESGYSNWILRFEFNREKMFNKNITMDDVNFVIQNAYGFYGERDDTLQTIYSDYNSQKLVMRIRPKLGGFMYGDDLAAIKKFLNALLNNTIVRGVAGIRAVTWRKDKNTVELQDGEYKQVDQYILDTDGSNFTAIMMHPCVDCTKLYSTNIYDIYNQLGIEATRSVLYSEINGLFDDADINYRHLGMLCDIMTHAGRPMSVDRYGINKMDNGPLAKACFEETEKVLKEAALFGEMDPVTGVSANIMMGQPIRAGTAFTQILLDEDALPRLLAGLPAVEEEEEEEPEGVSQEAIDQELYGEEIDPCTRLETQMNMILPNPDTSLIGEEDIEVVEITQEG